MRSTYFIILLLTFSAFVAQSQSLTLAKEDLLIYTSQWKGERFPDGRPKVPDAILQRMKDVSVEEAWGILRGEGYHNQYAGDWQIIHPEQVMVGRALTAQYMPK